MRHEKIDAEQKMFAAAMAFWFRFGLIPIAFPITFQRKMRWTVHDPSAETKKMETQKFRKLKKNQKLLPNHWDKPHEFEGYLVLAKYTKRKRGASE